MRQLELTEAESLVLKLVLEAHTEGDSYIYNPDNGRRRRLLWQIRHKLKAAEKKPDYGR